MGDPSSYDVQDQPHRTYTATGALSYGWKKFAASPATLLIPVIVAWGGVGVFALIVEAVLYTTVLSSHSCTRRAPGAILHTQCTPGLFTQGATSALGSVLILVVLQVLTAGVLRGALRITDGHDFSLGEMFHGFSKA